MKNFKKVSKLLLVTILSLGMFSNAVPAYLAQSQIVIKGSDWLNGKGVDVYHNGGNLNTQYQCVELVNRLYDHLGWQKPQTPDGGAKSMPEGLGDSGRLKFYPTNSGYIPVPGDLVIEGVSASNGWGHVAVVDRVDEITGTIHVVEQNQMHRRDGRSEYTKEAIGYGAPYYRAQVRGFIHAIENNFQPTKKEQKFPLVVEVEVTTTSWVYKDSKGKNYDHTVSDGYRDVIVGFDPYGTHPYKLERADGWVKEEELRVVEYDRFVSGDFDGDGLSDLAALYRSDDGAATIHVWRSSGHGYGGLEIWRYIPEGFYTERVEGRLVAGDFNGDGKDDLAVMYNFDTENDSSMRIHTFTSNGTSFSNWQEAYSSLNNGPYLTDYVDNRFVAGDFNGDGRDDLAALYLQGDGHFNLHVFSSMNVGDRIQFSYQPNLAPGLASNTIMNSRTLNSMVSGDFNGDGRDDIAMLYFVDNAMRIMTLITNNYGQLDLNMNSGYVNPTYLPNAVNGRLVSGDINGDKKDDIMVMYSFGNSVNLHTFTSKVGADGKVSFNANLNAGGSSGYYTDLVNNRVVAGDMNGDGIVDLTVMYDYFYGEYQFHTWNGNANGTFNRFYTSLASGGYYVEFLK